VKQHLSEKIQAPPYDDATTNVPLQRQAMPPPYDVVLLDQHQEPRGTAADDYAILNTASLLEQLQYDITSPNESHSEYVYVV